jgi:hypothetical protein
MSYKSTLNTLVTAAEGLGVPVIVDRPGRAGFQPPIRFPYIAIDMVPDLTLGPNSTTMAFDVRVLTKSGTDIADYTNDLEATYTLINQLVGALRRTAYNNGGPVLNSLDSVQAVGEIESYANSETGWMVTIELETDSDTTIC